MWQNTVLIGVSLSKPHVDHDNGPRTQNNGISVSVYHLPTFVTPWFPRSVYALKFSVYSSILKYSRV